MHLIRTARCLSVILLGTTLLTIAVPTSEAQTPQLPPPERPSPSVLPASGTDTTREPARQGPLLERQVDRDEYRIGPGDDMVLALFGAENQTIPLTVTPEGTLVIPSVGVVRVGGLSINDAEQRVAERIGHLFRNVDVSLSLTAVREFKVYLVGDVTHPGIRNATAVTRVAELIHPATDSGVARRNVVVRRTNGESVDADLARFLYLGELHQNPTLREGDMIRVPVVDETITVNGRVARPGIYEHRVGETLAEFLELVNGGGGFPANAGDTIRLMRFTDDPRGAVRQIAVHDAIGSVGQQLVLHPFDALFVPKLAHYREITTAEIIGEVVRPGIYPIRPNVTTVSDLVEMAGGFTFQASLLDATLRREPAQREYGADQQLQNIPPEFLSNDERRILQVTNRADTRNVVVDIRELFASEEAALDLPLLEGDVLQVPKVRNEVAVLGAVTQPGLVPFEPGKPLNYFVNLAGGYTERADQRDVVVLKAKLGNRLNRGDVNDLGPGDQIVVPFKEPKTIMQRFEEVNSVVSTISGLLITIVALDRLW